MIGDHIRGGDNALFDLLLHSQDVAYTVPEIAALAAAADLDITAVIEPWRYDPDSYINDGALRRRLATLDRIERAAVAELVVANIKKHTLYLVRAGCGEAAVARPDDPAAVPVLRDAHAASLVAGLTPTGEITVGLDGFKTIMRVPRTGRAMLGLVDGRRCLAAIHREVAAGPVKGMPWDLFIADFQQAFRVFNGINSLFLAFPPDRDGDGNRGTL